MSGARAKSGAFLLEFVIILLVFSLASAVCVRLFFTARSLAEGSDELDSAVAAATRASETLKSADGSDAASDAVFGASRAIYLDEAWRECAEGDAVYTISADLSAADGTAGRLLSGVVTVSAAGDGGEIYALDFARFYPAREALT